MKKLGNVAHALALCGWVSLSMVGCGKQDEQTPPAVGGAQKSVDKAVSDAQKPAEEQKAAAQPVAAEAQKSATEAASAASNQAQGLIDKVKTLIAEKKYTEALASLKELSALKLTPEQQKLVDDLKAQVQKAIASSAADDASKKATDAVGGLLNK